MPNNMDIRPILFVGPRRSGTTAVYDCLYALNANRMSKVKETFVFSSFKPNYKKFFEQFECTENEVIDFCPSVYGSPLAFANLMLFRDEFKLDPILVVINRDKEQAFRSCVDYFDKRNVLSNVGEELAVDSAFYQYFTDKNVEVLQGKFEVHEFEFGDVMQDGLGSLGVFLSDRNIEFNKSLRFMNSSKESVRDNFVSKLLLSVYRAVRSKLPNSVFQYLQKSKILGRLVMESDTKVPDPYVGQVTECILENYVISSEQARGKVGE